MKNFGLKINKIINKIGLFVLPVLFVILFVFVPKLANSAQTTFTTSLTTTGLTLAAPSIPASLVANAVSSSQIDLSWNASVPNYYPVAGYRIFRDGSILATTTALTYSDMGLSPETNYDYTVEAFDTMFQFSGQSSSATATTTAVPVIVPTPSVGGGGGSSGSSSGIIISNIKIIPGKDQAEISFDTNIETQSSLSWGFTNYFESGSLQGINYNYKHSQVITGLTEGLTYQLKITATASNGAVASKNTSFTTILPISEIGPLPNPSDFVAQADENSINLSWVNPEDPRFNDVRVVRTEGFYPIDQFDGLPLYEGNGESFIDTTAKPGVTYYYAIFSRDNVLQYSSGALAQARIALPGEVATTTVIDPFANIPQAKNVDPRIRALTLSDFEFIQEGKNLATIGETVAINGDKNLTIRLKYEKVPEILKTVAFTLKDPNDSTRVFPFLLRINSDKTAYEATIGALGKSGRYGMSVTILDYENNGLMRLDGTLAAMAFAPIINFNNGFDFLALLILFLIIVLIILAIILVRKWLYYSPDSSRKYQNTNKILASVFVVIFASSLLFGASIGINKVFAAINPQINYQGKLTNASNAIVPDGNYNIRFKLYTSIEGGVPVWTETWCNTSDCAGTGVGADNRIAISSGLFSTMLGSTTAFTGVDFNQPLYLGVEIGGSGAVASWDGEMSPRKIIGTVPAAFVAENANTLSGLNSEQFLRSDAQNATSSSSTFLSVVQTGAGKIAEFFGSASQSVLALLSNGNVGIGTTTPYAKLSVAGEVVAENFTATSTTASSVFPLLTSTTATTTNLAVTSIVSSLLKTNSLGQLVAATAGTDYSNFAYLFPSNATSTLLSFNGGLTSYASTTIGDGTQTGGLTISGGATTTGNASVGGSLSVTGSGSFAGVSGSTIVASTYFMSNTIYSTGGNTLSLNPDSVAGVSSRVLNTVSPNINTSGGSTVAFRISPTYNQTSTAGATDLLINRTETTIGSGAHYLFNAQVNNISRFAITNSGNIGIASTSPLYKLSVEGTSSLGNQAIAGYFTATSTTVSSVFPLLTSTTATTTNLAVTSIVSSLLKTNSLGQLVAATAGTDYSNFAYLFPGNATTTLLSFNGGLTSYASTTIGNGTQTGGLTISGGATTTGNAYFAGNVGVGVTTPLAKLSVNSNSANFTPVTIGTNSTFVANFADNLNDVSGVQMGNTNTGTNADFRFLIKDTSGHYFAFSQPSVNNSVAAVLGQARNSTDYIFNVGGTARNLTIGTIDAKDLIFGTNNAEVVRVSSAGNLGIGTTSPFTKLSVAGDAYIGGNLTATGTVTIGSLTGILQGINGTVSASSTLSIAYGGTGLSTAPTYGQVLLGQSNGTYTLVSTSSLGISGTGSTFDYLFPSNATTTLLSFNGGLTSYASTTIGNGTQTGGLTISGGATTTGNAYFAGRVGIGTNNPTENFVITSSSNNYTGFNISNTNGGSGGNYLFAVTGSTHPRPSAFGFYDNNASAYRMLINSAGNISIGANYTVNPASNLSVNNNFSVGSGYMTTAAPTNGAIIEGAVGIGSNNPGLYKLDVSNSTGYGIRSVAQHSDVVGSRRNYVLNAGSGDWWGLGINNSGDFAIDFLDPLGASSVANRLSIGVSTGNVGIGTTSPYAKLSVVGQVVGQYFTATSTTASTFPYASTTALTVSGTDGLRVGSLTGILQGINGTVSASSTLSIAYGGTGLSTAPTYGQVLLGQSNGTYTLVSTSSLGISGTGSTFDYLFPSNATTTLLSFNGGLTSYASTTIGNGTQTGGLTISGGATTTGNAYIAGNLGIGTTTPAYKLSVEGSSSLGNQAIAGYFTATSTTATSTFAGNITLGSRNYAANNSIAGGFGGISGSVLATGNGSFAWGNANVSAGGISATGDGSVAFGYQNVNSSSRGSFAFGYGSTNLGGEIYSSGYGSFSGGFSGSGSITASGNASFAFGDNITASNSLSTAFGSGFTNSTANSFMVGYGSTPTLTVTSSSVGIGTTSPFAKLAINPIAGDGNSFVIGSSTATNFVVTNAGNVGIGTTSPSAALAVNGKNVSSGSAPNAFVVYGGVSGSGASGGGIFMKTGSSVSGNGGAINLLTGDSADGVGGLINLIAGNGSTGYGGPITIQAGGGNSSFGGDDGNVTINPGFTAGTGKILLATNGGNVGIGTTSPYAKLSVVGQVVGQYFTATSTTVSSVFPLLTSTTATTTNLAVTSIVSSLLKTNSLGQLVAATAGTDYSNFAYLFPGNATTTLLSFNGGLTSYASTTIGNGTQTGGLTISGGATTTGNAYFVSNVGIGTNNPQTSLVVAGASTTDKQSFLSVDNMQLSQLNGGAYFGGVGIKESSIALNNYGVTWTARDSSRLWFKVAMSSDGRIQTAPVYGGQIYTSTDYGVTWTARDSSRNWSGVAMSSDGKIQSVVANGEQIYTSTDYGVTWTARDSNRNWARIAMSSDGKIQAATDQGGQIYTSTDYGVTWTARDSNRNWVGVAMSSDGKIQTSFVYPSGQIYTSTDYGVTWTARDSSRNWLGNAMSSDGKIQTATVSGGQIYISTDYGVTWTARDSNRNWNGIVMSSDGRIQTATVSGGQIYISTDYGVTWTARGVNRTWEGIAMSSDGRIQTATGSFQIFTSSADSYTPYGNFAIGTSSPYSTLSVWGSGTGTRRMFELTNSASTTLVSVLENGTSYFVGNVGIATTTPVTRLQVGQISTRASSLFGSQTIAVGSNSSVVSFAGVNTAASSNTGGAFTILHHDDGAAMASGDRLGGILFGGSVSSSALTNGAGLTAFAESAWSGSSAPTYLIFETAPSGSLTRTEKMRITSAGNVGIGSTTPFAKLSVASFGNGTQPQFVIASSTGSSATTTSFIVNQFGNVGIGLSNPETSLVVAGASTTDKQSFFSVDNMQLSQLNGGAYFGGVGIKENSIALNNYGVTWTARESVRLWRDVAMSSDGKIQTAVDSGPGQIYTSTDYGVTWTARDSSRGWYGVAMSSDGKIQTATVYPGNIYTSTDYGVTWTARDSSRDWKSVAMSSDGKIQAATVESGQIYTSTNYGVTWTARNSSRLWTTIAMSSDGKIQTAAVSGGQIYTSTDYGVTWTARDSSRLWFGNAMSSDGKIQTATASFNQIYTSTDYGVTWTARDSSRSWTGIAMSSDGKIQTATVSGGQIYTSTDYGVTWTARDSSRGWTGIAMSSDGKIQTAIHYNGQIYTSSADSYTSYGNFAIGTSSPYSTLSVWGSGTGTRRMFELTNSASTTLVSVLENGTSYFLGNIGIGTTSPFTKLSVAGDAYIGGNLTATGTVTIGSLTGILQGINGTVSASSTLSVAYGGTGLSTSPTYGQLLVGDGSGNYSLMATSTLGILASSAIGLGSIGQIPYYSTAEQAISATSSIFLATNSFVGIGTTTPTSALSVFSTASPQFQLAYDKDNYLTTGVSSSGGVTLASNGTLGGFTITNPQPTAVVSGTGTAAPLGLSVTGGIGGNSSDTNVGVGGIGGGIQLNAGVGGTALFATFSETGGAGGTVSIAGGAGGAAGSPSVDFMSRQAGAGGAMTLAGGAGGDASNGGTASTNTAGAGGAFILNGGAGGNASGATVNNGGAGGSLYITGGAGGTGSTANGSAGNVYLGYNSSSALGNVYFGNQNVSYISSTGNFGIGTTTPLYKLSVEGTSSLGNQAIAGYFTATSTTATSTFASGLSVSGSNPTAGNIQSGYLVSRYYSGISNNNIVLGASSLGDPNIRIQVDSPLAHIGFNRGGTINSAVTIQKDSGLSYGHINVRGEDMLTGIDSLQETRLGQNGNNFEIVNFKDNIFVNPTGGVFALRSTATTLVSPSSGAGMEFSYDADDATQGAIGRSSILSYDRGASAFKSLRFNAFDTRIQSSGTDVLTITNGGSVGIGTTTPWAKLAINPVAGDGNAFVVGSSTATNFVITNGGTVAIGGPTNTNFTTEFGIRNFANYTDSTNTNGYAFVLGRSNNTGANGAPNFFFTRNRSTAGAAIQDGDYVGRLSALPWDGDEGVFSSAINFRVNGTVADNSIPTDITFETGSQNSDLTERMRLTSGGNLGIGTTSPFAKLAINPIAGDGDSFVIGSSTATNFVVTNAGNVGIGDMSPNSRLDIKGDSDSNSYVEVTNTNGTPVRFVFGTVGGTGRGFAGTIGAHPFDFRTDNTARLTILPTSGNVGVGTTNPLGKLSVSDGNSIASGLTSALSGPYIVGSASGAFDATFISSSNTATTRAVSGMIRSRGTLSSPTAVQSDDTLGTFLFGGYDGSQVNFGGGLFAYADGNASAGNSPIRLSFVTGNNGTDRTEKLVIKSTGNVGIGTTTPFGKLSLSSFNNGTQPQFVIASSTGSSATTTSLIVDRFGNVGVGTTSPMANLSVVGNGTVGANPVLQITNTASASFVPGFSIMAPNLTTGQATYMNFGRSQSTNNSGSILFTYADSGSTNNRLGFNFYGGNEAVSILAGGNVGIGTTSPFYKLSVEGTSSLGNQAIAGYFTATSTTASTFPYASTTALTVSGSLYNTSLADGCLNVASGLIGSTGSACGSGGGSSYPFSLAGNATSTLTQFNGGLTSYASTTIGDGTQTGGLTISGGATTTGNAYFAGIVGIGTTTPDRTLNVNGNATFGTIGASTATANPLNVSFGSTYGNSTAGSVNNLKWDLFTSSSSGSRYGIGMSSGLMEFQSGPSGGHAFFVNQGTEAMRISSSGNVGVGTASPYGTLTVKNNTDGAELLTLQTAYISPSGRQALTWRDTTNITGQIDTNYSGGIMSMSFGHLYNGGYQTGDVMTLRGNGNVGIGTTSPYAKLSVVGQIAAEYFTATSTTATTTLAGGLEVGQGNLMYDFTTGVTSIASLQTGNLNFDTDAGVISWVDLPVVSASSGTVQSYSAQIAGQSLLTVYGISNGSGSITGGTVSMGTSTPYTNGLTVWGRDTLAATRSFDVVNNASSSLLTVYNDGAVKIGGTTSTTTINGYLDVLGTGTNSTSTIASNLWVKGNMRANLSYVGDLIFANNFAFTEGLPINSTTTQSLYLKNQVGEKIFGIDDQGNMIVTGDICSKNVACVSESLSKLTTDMNILASSTASLQSSLTTSSSVQSLADAIVALDLKVDAFIASSTSDINLIIASTTSALASSTDFVMNVSSSTANILATDSSFVNVIANAVKNILSSTQDWMVERFTARVAYLNRVEAETVAISKGMEIVDQVSGITWCVTIKNGDWNKIQGSCASVASTTPNPVIATPTPTPSPIIPIIETPDTASSTDTVSGAGATSTPETSTATSSQSVASTTSSEISLSPTPTPTVETTPSPSPTVEATPSASPSPSITLVETSPSPTVSPVSEPVTSSEPAPAPETVSSEPVPAPLTETP